MRIKENKEVYEGEVTELTPEFTESEVSAGRQAGRRVGGGQACRQAGRQACRQSNQTGLQVDNGAQGLGVEGSGHLLPAYHL